MIMSASERNCALEKIAYGFANQPYCPTVGESYPRPSTGDVLSAIGFAQSRGIGTQSERTDAFGKIINSGLRNTSPAGNALRMIGGGILGNVLTGAFTKNPWIKGLAAGIGALSAIRND